MGGEEELCNLYSSILEGLDAQGFSLLDDEYFLYVAATGEMVDPFFGGPIELSDEVKSTFLTEYGATPIESVEELTSAMTVLYRGRVDRGLEHEAIFDVFPLPEVYGCGEETLETAWMLVDQFYEAISRDLHLINQREFLQFVALYFTPIFPSGKRAK